MIVVTCPVNYIVNGPNVSSYIQSSGWKFEFAFVAIRNDLTTQ